MITVFLRTKDSDNSSTKEIDPNHIADITAERKGSIIKMKDGSELRVYDAPHRLRVVTQ